MPFTSGKRASGQGGVSGQTTTARIRTAGRGASSKRNRTRGSGQLRIVQPTSSISVVTTTTWTVDVVYDNPEVRPSEVFVVVSENPKQPSPSQIIAGVDYGGVDAVAKADTAVTLPTNAIGITGLTLDTLYYIFTVVQDTLLRVSTVDAISQRTLAA